MARYTYETKFNLTNPVNDFDAASDYLSEDDMTEYLKDDIEYESGRGNCDIDPETIEHIEWILKDDQSGKVVLDTTSELTDPQLKYISQWVSGQCSDGIGEGFEQQSFAEIYDVDEWGDPIDDTYDMASFDWETNNYPFKLVKTQESKIYEEEAPLKNSILASHFVFDSNLNDDAFKKTRNWLEGLDLKGIQKYLSLFPKDKIKKAEIIMKNDFGFDVKVYTFFDLSTLDESMVDDLEKAVEKYVMAVIEPNYQKQPFGQVVTKREIYYKQAKCEGKTIQESMDPTESNPLKIDAPRGAYWIWKTGNTIYGSAERPNPNQIIHNARSVIDFTSQGFDDVDEVVAYVKKYF